MTLCTRVTKCHQHYVADSAFSKETRDLLEKHTDVMSKISKQLDALTLNIMMLTNAIRDQSDKRQEDEHHELHQQYYDPADDPENWDWPY